MKLVSTNDKAYWGTGPDTQWGRNILASGAASGMRNSIYVAGDPDDPATPIAAIVEYPPGWDFPRHSHASGRVEVIITGSITVGDHVLGPGSIMTADKDETYGPHTIGPEGCTTVEVMSVSGACFLTFETADGPQTINFDDPNALSNLASAGRPTPMTS